PRLQAIAQNLVKWDEATPYLYDHRWISHHWAKSDVSGLTPGKSDGRPLTLPNDQWHAIAVTNRADFMKAVDQAVHASSESKPTQ
ncbi:hypothetical protein, partial [Mesorhizobium ciceri]|uniref:hypothetical protein n=1 Tax=Mesorhizobium ciceri TaxID=39645 RepID=UPI003450543C